MNNANKDIRHGEIQDTGQNEKKGKRRDEKVGQMMKKGRINNNKRDKKDRLKFLCAEV